MLTRRIPRALMPTYQIMKSAAAHGSTRISNLAQYMSPRTLQALVPKRLYSEKIEVDQVEAMTTDYNYVKRATEDSKVLIVDVREPDEIQEHGKIPSSINIPLGSITTVLSDMPESEFKKNFNKQKPSKDTEIIFYCMIGKRSGKAQQNAINAGYKNTKNYLGSWNDWASKQVAA